jgi:hypothetical protein
MPGTSSCTISRTRISFLLQLARHFAHLVLVERMVNGAVGQQALRHFVAQRTAHQWFMLGEEQVVGVGTVDASDFIDIAETLRDQQRRLGAGALEQGVDGDGRTVQEQTAVLDVRAGAVERVLDAVDQLAVRGQGLAEGQFAGAFVQDRQVGEGAADVDREAQVAVLF